MSRIPGYPLPSLAVGGLLAVALAVGCSVTDPPEKTENPGFARAASNPAVTSTLPSYAHQGNAGVMVRIIGSGFDQGSVASWQRGGVADPKVTVQSTRYVSSTELVATISVAPDATIAYYDIAVRTAGGKKGIGMEMFTVTAAQSIGTLGGNTLARGVNDQGAVVGYSMVGSSQHAFFAGPNAAMMDLGTGQAYDLDPSGTVVTGVTSAGGVVWRNNGGSWTSTPLPQNGAGSRASTIALTSTGLIIGGSVGVRLSSRTTQTRPAIWRETAAGWSLWDYPVPAGFTSAWIEDVNPLGQAVGYARDPYSKAYVWEADGTAAALTPVPGDRLPFAHGINPAGTVVVGSSGGGAVYWKRAADGSWGPPQMLESCGRALDINSRGIIVGQGCENATVWQLNGDGTVTRTRLQGLGANSEAPAVEAINNAEFPQAAGAAKPQGSSTDQGVLWNLNVALGF